MSEPLRSSGPQSQRVQSDTPAIELPASGPARQLSRLAVVLAGIVLGQFFLFGPSLLGHRILLPLDILTGPGIYLPVAHPESAPRIENLYLSDLVYVFEPVRRFFHDELAAGRWPAWVPWQFAGAPFSSPRFSPFLILQALTASPVVIAWAQLVVACVAGLGAYVFCRRVPRLGFWPSAFAGWTYPLTGFFVFWQGYPTALPVCWLPWLLVAVDSTVRRTWRFAPVAVAVLTMLVLISGSLDVAGQVLVVSGVFAIWSLYDTEGMAWATRRAMKSVAVLAAGWALGLLLATPYVLPLVEYSQTGQRLIQRGEGAEERPPTGLGALPQWVLPDIYGRFGIWKTDSFRYTRDSQQESTAAGYAGFAATLLLAPLAWSENRRRNRLVIFFGLVSAFALCWPVGVPGAVQLLRLPGLNMFSHNRWMFAAAFAVTACAAMGLEHLRVSRLSWHRWMWLPAALCFGLAFYCLTSVALPPEPIATELEHVIRGGGQAGWIRDLESLETVRNDFAVRFGIGAALAASAFGCWLLARSRPAWLARGGAAIAAIVIADLLWFAHDRSVQSSPTLYYPPIPALQQAAASEVSGRVIGYRCLPANLAAMAGLRDVRGYDAVDPARMIRLLSAGAEPGGKPLSYAVTQWLAPAFSIREDGTLRLSPILDLLGVRYVVFRDVPPPGLNPVFQSPDYSVGENTNALPRAFVPARVSVVPDAEERLRLLASVDFNPRLTALVEDPVNLSVVAQGSATVLQESPVQVAVRAEVSGPALLVLADHWDAGWRATVNGEARPVMRVNHALRGVPLGPGESLVEFHYRPRSFVLGLALAGIATGMLLLWAAVLSFQRKPETGAVPA